MAMSQNRQGGKHPWPPEVTAVLRISRDLLSTTGHRAAATEIDRIISKFDPASNGSAVPGSVLPVTHGELTEPCLAVCIGCDCDDFHACTDKDGNSCHWLRLDREAGIGVCAQCPDSVVEWDARVRAKAGGNDLGRN